MTTAQKVQIEEIRARWEAGRACADVKTLLDLVDALAPLPWRCACGSGRALVSAGPLSPLVMCPECRAGYFFVASSSNPHPAKRAP